MKTKTTAPRRLRIAQLVLSAFSLQVFSLLLPAADKYWDGGDALWSSGTWRLGAPDGAVTVAPVAADNVYIDSARAVIAAGVTATNAVSNIGSAAGASGTVSVAGVWRNSNLYVGGSGAGFVHIQSTGTMISSAGPIVGRYAGSSGYILVDGNWQQAGTFYLGNEGAGTLEIGVNGKVIGTGAVGVGQTAAASGTVIVAGLWQHATRGINIGNTGAGFLEIKSTGTVSDGSGYLGNNAGSYGSGTVAGLWENTGAFYLGNSGTGIMRIGSTGKVTDTVGFIGNAASGNGAAFVAGFWQNSSTLFVGNSGDAFLRIERTGTVTNTVGNIGFAAGSSGTVSVAGLWQSSGVFQAGYYGDAFLHIERTGTVANTGAPTVARYAASTAKILVDGFWQTGASTFYLGYEGNATLEIGVTGTVKGTGAVGVAQSAAGYGEASVAGVWHHDTRSIFVGNYGTGVLRLKATGTVIDGIGAIGNYAGSTGTAFVAGHWDNSSSFQVGNNGDGVLYLESTGIITNASGFIGSGAGVTGTAFVAGFWENSGSLAIGNFGKGFLHIKSGGVVTHTGQANIGRYASGSGYVLVDGLWGHGSSTFYIGNEGVGTLEIGVTGTVSGDCAVGVAQTLNGSGTAIVAGRWDHGSRSIFVGNYGEGFLEIKSTGVVSDGIGALGNNGGASGKAVVAGLWENSSFANGNTANTASGYLHIKPTGTVATTGAYAQNASSTLRVELQPGRQTAYVTAGSARLDGALIVDGYDASQPRTKASQLLDDTVVIINAPGGIAGNFSSVTLTGAGGGGSHSHIILGGFASNSGEYRTGRVLAWQAGGEIAHGNFDIAAGEAFEIDITLGDRGGNSAWDGKSLTKLGDGTLILSAENTYTGLTAVRSGTLMLSGGATMRLGALDNHGVVDFGAPSSAVPAAPPGSVIKPALDGFRALTVDSLAGDGAIRMKIAPAFGKSDQLIVLGDATGTHRLLITPVDRAIDAAPLGDESMLNLVRIGGVAGADFPLIDAGTGLVFDGGFDYGAFNYTVERRGNAIVLVNNGLNLSGEAIRGVPGAQSVLWFDQQDNLGRRLGELRVPKDAIGGRDPGSRWMLWARGHASRADLDTVGDGRDSEFTLWGMEIGLDKTWFLADERVSLGVFAGYGKADQDFASRADSTGASGSNELFGGGIYAAWLNSRGWFADATLSAGSLGNTFDAADQSRNVTTGDFRDASRGVALEAGRRFAFNAGWFAEPAVQFSRVWIDRSDYITGGANRISVRSADASVTRLRAALRGGRAWWLGGGTDGAFLELAARIAFAHETSSGGEIHVGGAGWRPNLDGDRVEAGVGVNWCPSANCQLYFDYEAARGSDYEKPWGFSLGVRCLF